MTNRQAFVTSLAVLAAAFDRKLTSEAIEAYWLALGDLEDTEFAAATKRALQSCKFMPTPAELLECAGVTVPTREERERQVRREETQREIDREVARTNRHLDAMFGRSQATQLTGAVVNELAEAKSKPLREMARISESEKTAALGTMAKQLAEWKAQNG